MPAGETVPVLVRLEGVVREFRGSSGTVRALDGVSLEVRSGEIFGILGRSGAGKSTLLRCITAGEGPDAGRVWFDGQELQGLRRPALRAVRRRIGTIYQHFHLVKTANVWENVALPLRLHGLPRREVVPRVDRFLNLVGLSDKAKAYPAQLSGGQKQRVAIARALAGEPELLLSDEGTSALDPETKESILDLLRQIHRQLGITIVLITHELSVIQAVCHRVAIMDAGRIIESGSVEAVFSHPEQALTKSFLRQFWHDRLADDTVGQPAPGRRFVLSYSGESALRPALAEAAQRFGVRPNILSGVVTRLGDAPFGRLVIQIDEPADGALAFLRETGVQVEEVFHELG